MSWYDRYMMDAVTKESLMKLVAAGKMPQEELDIMIKDRLEKYGY